MPDTYIGVRKNNFNFLKMGDQLDFTISHLPKDIPPQLLQDRAGRCALDVADVVTEAGFLVG